jgi:chromosome segregation ATPase
MKEKLKRCETDLEELKSELATLTTEQAYLQAHADGLIKALEFCDDILAELESAGASHQKLDSLSQRKNSLYGELQAVQNSIEKINGKLVDIQKRGNEVSGARSKALAELVKVKLSSEISQHDVLVSQLFKSLKNIAAYREILMGVAPNAIQEVLPLPDGYLSGVRISKIDGYTPAAMATCEGNFRPEYDLVKRLLTEVGN